MGELCTDNRFKIIDKAKRDLLEGTNIDTSPDEMKVLNSFLFRCWQMGWLDKYEEKECRYDCPCLAWNEEDDDWTRKMNNCNNCNFCHPNSDIVEGN